MKGLLVITAGLLIGLSLLVPAVLSYETPYGTSADRGMAIQSDSQNPLTVPSDSGTGQQNDPSAYQQNGSSAYWMNRLPNPSGNASTEPPSQPRPGGYGTICMEMGGASC